MKKILAIVHDIHAAITDETIHSTLEKHYGSCHFEAIRFEHINIEHGDNSQLIWSTWKQEQSAYFKEAIKPKIDEDPDRQVVYFGIAPIPLCMHLGYLVGELRNVDVFQRLHNENNDWNWGNKKSDKLIIDNLPKSVSKSKEITVIRFGTYAKIDPSITYNITPITSHEIDVYPNKPRADYFGNMEALNAAAEDFFVATKEMSEAYPESEEIHLFAAVPCGLAFLMGKKIQRNAHRNIKIFQYHVRQEPKYSEAFVIQEQTEQELIIPQEELKNIREIKKDLELHYQKSIEWFISDNAEDDQPNWFLSILPKHNSTPFTQFPWNTLTKIGNTILAGAVFSEDPLDEFETKFFVNGKWYFPDWLIYRLNEKFDRNDLKTAMRLFWFHEGIHYTDHKLNSDNTEGLGRYARVLEEADYQSDVYALFCEYGFSKKEAFKNEVNFFAARIEILIKTMQAFDGKNTIARMQSRRVNRYLIWHFQLARIRDTNCRSLDNIIEILSNKPSIDLKLPLRLEERDKIFYQLSGYEIQDIGIAFFFNNKVLSFGPNGSQLNLKKLIDGLRTSNSESILEVIRQVLPILI